MHQEPKNLAKQGWLSPHIRLYLVVGVMAVGADAVSYFALRRLDVSHAVAKGISFVVGSVVAFVLNKYLTFARPRFSFREVERFVCLYLTTLCTNVAVFASTRDLTNVPRWPLACFFFATGTSTVLNYLGQRYWVFVEHSDERSGPASNVRLGAHDYLPALACFVTCAWFLRDTYPTLFQNGEMWAEAATNYFRNAHAHSVLENIIALDFSYLPIVVRLWAVLVQFLGVLPASAPMVYQNIALLSISACVGFFALPQFRSLLASDLARVFVCAALALCPDYEVKSFINFSYFLAIVVYLILAWSVSRGEVGRRPALLWGGLLTLAALSKPHFLSFAPILGVLTFVSVYRRHSWSSVLYGLPLVGCITQLLVAVTHRSEIAQDGPLSLDQAFALWAKWIPVTLMSQLFGQFLTDSQSNFKLCGYLCGFTVVCLAFPIRRQWVKASLWPMAIGTVTLGFGTLLSVTAYPKMYAPHGGHFPIEHMGNRHWFIPTLVLFLTFAIILGRVLPRRWSPLLIGAWLPLSFPFGWHQKGHDQAWPVANVSAWRGFAPYVFAARGDTPERGCIPINPYPWYFSIDCELLMPLENPHANEALPLAASYTAPPDAGDWSVDSVAMRLSEPHTGRRTLVAYDSSGMELGRGVEIEANKSHLTHFYFKTPVTSPHRVVLLAPDSKTLSVVMNGAKNAPNWIWFGKKLATREEKTSQAAR